MATVMTCEDRHMFNLPTNFRLPGFRVGLPDDPPDQNTETVPGFVEVDLVAHCGWTGAGPFLYTLTRGRGPLAG